MDKSGAGAFVFAKASGNLGNSFVGSRAHILFEQKSLGEMWSLLFKTPVPMMPEVLLAEKIEDEAFVKFFKEFIYFVNQYDDPNPVLLDQLCIYEAENIKEIGSALCSGKTKLPKLYDIGNYTECNYKAWPDMAGITAGTQYSWYDHAPTVHEQKDMDFRLDIQIVKHLWKSLMQEKGESYAVLERLFKTEYVIKNIVWAIRLRLYYKMSKDDVINKLIYVTDHPSVTDPIAGPAIKILDFPLDEPEPWENWKYNELVNPRMPGEVWQIDPTWIEKRGKAKLNKIASNLFHQYPMTDCSLMGWYKIKEYELSCIRTAVESLRLNINSEEAMKAVGIDSEGGMNG